MKKLRIESESRDVYDVEHVNRQEIYLKGIGRYCKCGCGKHVIGDPRKIFYTKTHWWNWKQKTEGIKREGKTLRCIISIDKENEKRILRIYPKKNIKFDFIITPKYKELWSFMNKIESSRNNI